MKAIILAGGWGTRLGALTDYKPKPMVEIGDRPILWHIMKVFSHYGIKDFIICLGVMGPVIKEYFFNYEMLNNDFTIDLKDNKVSIAPRSEREDWTVTLADTGLNTLKGGRIKRIEKYLDSDINIVTYGDGVADVNIKELVEYHHEHGKLVTITGVHPPARFGELVEDQGLVVSFKEKPKASTGLINGGFIVFNRGMLEHLTEDEDCDFEKGPLEELSKAGEVMVYRHTGRWECMDHERDVVHLNKLWKENQAFWKVWE